MPLPFFQTPGEAFCFFNLSEYSAAARTSLPPPFLVNREPLYLQPAFLTAAFMPSHAPQICWSVITTCSIKREGLSAGLHLCMHAEFIQTQVHSESAAAGYFANIHFHYVHDSLCFDCASL